MLPLAPFPDPRESDSALGFVSGIQTDHHTLRWAYDTGRLLMERSDYLADSRNYPRSSRFGKASSSNSSGIG